MHNSALASLIIAFHLWSMPACGTPRITVEPQDSGLYAWADSTACTIRFNRQFIQRIRQAPRLMCAIVVHEWGHLTGHDHSTDPSNIMYPIIDPWNRTNFQMCALKISHTRDGWIRVSLKLPGFALSNQQFHDIEVDAANLMHSY